MQLLCDESFYEDCPAFLWLRQPALEARARAGCLSCGGGLKAFRHVCDAFFKNLRELHALHPEHVACVRLYLERRKKKPIAGVVIYYRASRDQPRPLKFEF